MLFWSHYYVYFGIIFGVWYNFFYLISYIFGSYEFLGYEYETSSVDYSILLILLYSIFVLLFSFPYLLFFLFTPYKSYLFRLVVFLLYLYLFFSFSVIEYTRFEFVQVIQDWHDTKNGLNLKFTFALHNDIIIFLYYSITVIILLLISFLIKNILLQWLSFFLFRFISKSTLSRIIVCIIMLSFGSSIYTIITVILIFELFIFCTIGVLGALYYHQPNPIVPAIRG